MKNLIFTLLIFAFTGLSLGYAVEPKLFMPEEVVECEEYVSITPCNDDETLYGIVSYYGERWNGRTTANMEIYDHRLLTCASPRLPFNTVIEITNLANNKSIVVRVNDRGPYKMDRNGKALRPLQAHPVRVLDLSEAAFESIGDLDTGLLNVRYRIR
jgi:rare lipoprotein A